MATPGAQRVTSAAVEMRVGGLTNSSILYIDVALQSRQARDRWVDARPQAENGREYIRLPVQRSLESRLRPRACQTVLRGRCARDLKCTAWFTLRRVAVCSSLEVVHARRHPWAVARQTQPIARDVEDVEHLV